MHVFSFVSCNMELDVVSVFTNIRYNCVVMAHDENLGRNSGRNLSLSNRKNLPGNLMP